MISVSEKLKESRESLRRLFARGESPERFHEDHAEIVDQYFRRSLQESEIAPSLFRDRISFALVAVGGYGRKELCYHSDIDILLLFRKKIPPRVKELLQEVVFPLWDLGYDVGYGTRTVKDCIDLSGQDFEVLTSMMDSRFICGDSRLYLSTMEEMGKKVIRRKASMFSRWIKDADKLRMERYGDAGHLLEPDLKEGIGGLRDYHHMLWLSRVHFGLRSPRDLEYMGKLSHREYQDLRKGLIFLWTVRSRLHQLSGRKSDRLGIDYQEEIARSLGFRGQRPAGGVELFLGKLHACMSSIKSLHTAFLKTHLPRNDLSGSGFRIHDRLHLFNGEINFNSATVLLEDPYLLMEIFEQSGRLGSPLSLEARRLVREFIYLVDEPFRHSKRAARGFLEIINSSKGFDVLDQMFDTGFLDAYIPEFAEVRDRVQFDTYHIYPVGRHLLETLHRLEGLPGHKEILLFDIFAELTHPETLLLAGLLHDVGKSGTGHARRGVGIVKKILGRMGYDKDGMHDILFLVGHHLLMAETATRRDLNDEKVVVQCARTIGSIERLKMLYLLTWADSTATGPRAWNEWIADLVQELFFKVLHVLERGELAYPAASRKSNRTRSEIARKMGHRMDPAVLDELFEAMPARYLLNTPPALVVEHLSMVRGLAREVKAGSSTAFMLQALKVEGGDWWRVNLVARDRPGLFSDISGVLALHNINILSAEIYTWRKGTAVDIFRVTSPLDTIHSAEIWDRVRKNLADVFNGRLGLSCRLDCKALPHAGNGRRSGIRPARVGVDNESSDFFTLIEVFAEDRMGLLHRITRTLFDLRLDIRVAKIATKGDLAADVFYVLDIEGRKIAEPGRVEEIRKTLLHKLNANPTHGLSE